MWRNVRREQEIKGSGDDVVGSAEKAVEETRKRR